MSGYLIGDLTKTEDEDAIRNAIPREVYGFEIRFRPVVLAPGLQSDIRSDFAVKGIRSHGQLGPQHSKCSHFRRVSTSSGRV